MTASFDMDAMIAQLRPEEGDRLRVYDDKTGQPIVKGSSVQGNPTIGIGRNLSGKGISEDEARYLCANDIRECSSDLDLHLPWWKSLSPARQMQILDLRFNMGMRGLLSFHHFLAAMQAGEWQRAVDELRDSDWWHQVGERGPMIAARILEG